MYARLVGRLVSTSTSYEVASLKVLCRSHSQEAGTTTVQMILMVKIKCLDTSLVRFLESQKYI